MTQLVKASTQLATSLGIEPQQMIETIKRQCFRGTHPEQITNEQLAAFVAVANELKVNPLLPGMLYAYPDRGAIFPIIGPDGVYKRLSEHPDVDSWETTVFPEDPNHQPTHATTLIYRKGREAPIKYTAYLSEWKVGNNPNWNTRPRHMLGLRSLKQAARQVIHGLPGDEDDRIISGVVDVTPDAPAEQPPTRPEPAKRATRGAAAAKESAAEAAKAVTPAAAPAPEKKASNVVDADYTMAGEPEKPAEPEKKAEPVKDPAPAAEPVTKLADKQRITFEGCKVEEFVRKPINGQPSVIGQLSGPFAGKVYHLNGDENPAWQLNQPIVVTLTGKLLKSGEVAAMVESIELSTSAESGESLE